jgi:multidrug efflux pump subunit AcrB
MMFRMIFMIIRVPRIGTDRGLDVTGKAATVRHRCAKRFQLLAVAVGIVHIVLGMLYESAIQPLTILSGLPAAGLGALITLWLFGNELNGIRLSDSSCWSAS